MSQFNAQFEAAFDTYKTDWPRVFTLLGYGNGIDKYRILWHLRKAALADFPLNKIDDLFEKVRAAGCHKYDIESLSHKLLANAVVSCRHDLIPSLTAEGANLDLAMIHFIGGMDNPAKSSQLCDLEKIRMYKEAEDRKQLQAQLDEAKSEITTLRTTVEALSKRLDAIEGPPPDNLEKSLIPKSRPGIR